jgi:hypothetical protein
MLEACWRLLHSAAMVTCLHQRSHEQCMLAADKALVGEVVLELSTSTGQRVRAFSDKSGSFVFHNVPAGTHLLHVLTLGFLYPEVGAVVMQQQVTSLATTMACTHH